MFNIPCLFISKSVSDIGSDAFFVLSNSVLFLARLVVFVEIQIDR
jgi:hypothetical protein